MQTFFQLLDTGQYDAVIIVIAVVLMLICQGMETGWR